MEIILKSLYLILPGILANMAPVIFKRINFLNYPIDFNKTLNEKPIFGNHKTYRGLFFGIIFSILIVLIQRKLHAYEFFENISLINYQNVNILLLGFLIGFGVLFGDLTKSFFKRRLNIKPGERWFPFDQLDSLIGGLVFVSFVYTPPLEIILILIIMAIGLSIFTNYLGYKLKLKDTRW